MSPGVHSRVHPWDEQFHRTDVWLAQKFRASSPFSSTIA